MKFVVYISFGTFDLVHSETIFTVLVDKSFVNEANTLVNKSFLQF